MVEKKGVLITFSIKNQKFKPSERTVFFRKLYGWKQIVKTYEYERPGILDEIPHEKIGQSSFIVPEDEIERIMNFFEEWSNKVMFKTFKVLLEKDIFEGMLEKFRKLEEEEVE